MVADPKTSLHGSHVTLPECRFCKAPLEHVMCDLGLSPLANSYVPWEAGRNGETFYPLRVWVCDRCLLAQLEEFESPEAIFSDYAYFSSYSTSWVEHARQYCEMMIDRFRFDRGSRIIEIASNDGYLLQHFKARGIPVLGIEPARNVAEVAVNERKIPTVVRFFGVKLARELREKQGPADLLLGNNVLAHVPDLNDFVAGLKIALADHGVITFEFPHLLRLLQGNQFDTIYHEHFSYLSLTSVERIFLGHGLVIFDVEEIPTHGGSLRIFAKHRDCDDSRLVASSQPARIRQAEQDYGLAVPETYAAFGNRVRAVKYQLVSFLMQARQEGKVAVCYGAAAKGVTLVNYCGIRDDLVDYVVDKSPHKQRHFIPGVRLPIYGPDRIFETRPDYVLILPWNLRNEISSEMAAIRDWGGKFVVPIPELEVF